MIYTEKNNQSFKADAVFNYLNSVQNQELIDALKQADNPNLEENIWTVFTYQTSNGLVISLQVPHALGDRAEIISYLIGI
jgi:hypothetical protein